MPMHENEMTVKWTRPYEQLNHRVLFLKW